MITEDIILNMGIILALAMLLGAVLEKYRFPSAIGYIIAGILVGPVLGVVQSNDVLELFSEVGLIMLLFYIGLELDPYKLKTGGLTALIMGPTKIIIKFILGFLVGRVFGLGMIESGFLGAITMMSSTAICGKYLMDRNEMKTLAASISITMLLMEDFVAIILLAVLSSVTSGAETDIGALVFTSVAVVLVFLYVISEYSKYVMSFIEKFEYRRYIALYSLGLVFLLSYIVNFFGLSAGIGAFLAGYLMSRAPHSDKIRNELSTFREFFSAFFFVSIGMMFTIITDVFGYLMMFTLLAVSLIGTFFVCGLIGRYLGLDSELASKIFALLIPIGEFSLIIASYAKRLNLAHADVILSSAIFLSLITAFMMPYGIRAIPAITRILGKVKTSRRFSIAGIIAKESARSEELHETLISVFRSVSLYLMAGFSVVYLLTMAGSRINFQLLGYSSQAIMDGLAIVLIIPVLYGIARKFRWLGVRLVKIAGPSIFPDLKDYHLEWIQRYLADFLSGFSLMVTAMFLGVLIAFLAPDYVLFPALVFALGVFYAAKGYLISLEHYELIRRGIRTKRRMKWVAGRVQKRQRKER